MESRRGRTTRNTPQVGATGVAGADASELDAVDSPAEPGRTWTARAYAGSCCCARGARSRLAECGGAPLEEPRVCTPGARPRKASLRTKDAQPSTAGEASVLLACLSELTSSHEPPSSSEPPAEPTINAESRAVSAGPRRVRGARSTREPRAPASPAQLRACAPRACPRRASVRAKEARPAAPELPANSEPPDVDPPAVSAGPRRGRGARSTREPRAAASPAQLPPCAPRARPQRASVRLKDAQPSTANEAPALLVGDPEPSATQLSATPEPPAAAESPSSAEPPALAAGPRRGRGAAAARELRARSLGRREVTSDDWNPRPVLDKLRLKRTEISAAAKVVNRVVEDLLRRVRNRESEFKEIDLLNTGSYYERVKISAPNEFDVMFKLQVPRIELQEYCNTGAYYFVKFKRLKNGNPLNQFLEEEILSASKMLSKFRKIIEEEVKNIKGTNISVEEEKPGSPAVTLIIRNPEEISVDIILALESKGSWPASTKEGLPIESWLGRKVRTKLRLEPFYLVPKNAKEGDGFQGETWRLSFSHTEKYILNNHGADKTCCEADGVKCCRKECLKLMKYLLEQLKKEFKELDKFCSYHVKTAIFHMWTKNPQDSEWDPKHLRSCFLNFVTYFIECLKTEKLDHFFIPKFNLFSQELVDTKSKEFLSKKIEYERNNRFPIFDKF